MWRRESGSAVSTSRKTYGPGGVTFLSHSGSLFSAMLHNQRGIRFNLVVSTGIEINTTMDAYMRWALELESTRVLALFLETVRDPDGFRQALARADEMDVPVIALKVGATSEGQEAVATHSEGSLVMTPSTRRFSRLMASTVSGTWTRWPTPSSCSPPAAGRRHRVSEPSMIPGRKGAPHDTADRVGVPLPPLGEAATTRLSRVLDPGLEPVNPIDAWGTGRDAEEVFVECLQAVADDPAVGVVAFCVDLTAEEKPDYAYSDAAFTVAGRTVKPLVVLSNLTTTVDPAQAGRLREGGIPVLEGTETGLRAIRHLLDRHVRSMRPRSRRDSALHPTRCRWWRAKPPRCRSWIRTASRCRASRSLAMRLRYWRRQSGSVSPRLEDGRVG